MCVENWDINKSVLHQSILFLEIQLFLLTKKKISCMEDFCIELTVC